MAVLWWNVSSNVLEQVEGERARAQGGMSGACTAVCQGWPGWTCNVTAAKAYETEFK